MKRSRHSRVLQHSSEGKAVEDVTLLGSKCSMWYGSNYVPIRLIYNTFVPSYKFDANVLQSEQFNSFYLSNCKFSLHVFV